MATGFATVIGTGAAIGIERVSKPRPYLNFHPAGLTLVAPAFSYAYAAALGTAGMYCARVST